MNFCSMTPRFNFAELPYKANTGVSVQLSSQCYSTHRQWLHFPGRRKRLCWKGNTQPSQKECVEATQGAGPSALTAQPCSSGTALSLLHPRLVTCAGSECAKGWAKSCAKSCAKGCAKSWAKCCAKSCAKSCEPQGRQENLQLTLREQHKHSLPCQVPRDKGMTPMCESKEQIQQGKAPSGGREDLWEATFWVLVCFPAHWPFTCAQSCTFHQQGQ